MKKEKNINYYRDLLHKDSVVLLIISIIFAIANVVFIGKGSDDAVPIFLKSIMFTIFLIVLICNKKENKKFVGVLSIITGCLMILTSIGDGSLFGIVYFLLGAFYIIHSVIYLNKLKSTNYNEQIANNNNKKDSNLKYLTLIPNFFASLFILGIIQDEAIKGIIIFTVVIIVNIINIIFCVFLNKKYNKSILTYFTMIISILAVLINGVMLIDNVGLEIHNRQKYNSEEYVVERCKSTEGAINDKITLLKNLTDLNVSIGENATIQLGDYLALDSVYGIDVAGLKELESEGYVCDGYTILNWNENLNITSYYDVSSKLLYPFNMKNYFSNVETYIKCSGKYNYQTNGFNEKLLKEDN